MSLELFIQYIDLIKSFEPSESEVHGIIGSEHTLLFRLYKGIKERAFVDDVTAAKELYGKEPTFPAYKTLKSDLKKRLINLIMVLDYRKPVLNDYQQAFYTCQKNWAAINILRGRAKNVAATDLAQTTLEIARRYELSEMVVNTTRVLASYYHLHKPNNKLGDVYQEMHEHYYDIWQAEILSGRLLDDLSKHFIKIRATQRHLQEKANNYYSTVKPYLEKYDNFNLHTNSRYIQVLSYLCVNDYNNGLKQANDAISFLEKKPYEVKSQIALFLNLKVLCCIQLKYLEEGMKAIERSQELNIKGSNNWFRSQLYKIQLFLYSERFGDAWKTYIDVKMDPLFVQLGSIIKEEYNLYEAYLQYLVSIKVIQAQRSELRYVKSFKAHEFLHMVPTFQKDKRGLNIPILLIQILWLISENDKEAARIRIEALFRYNTRQLLKDEDTYRANLLIRMIRIMEKSSFSRRLTVRKTEKYFEELKSAPVHLKYQAHAMEILPFEKTWTLMLNAL